MNEEQNPWADPTQKKVTIEEMNELARKYKAAKEAHMELKRQATELYHAQEEAEKNLVSALKSSGTSKFFVEGLGTAYIINRYTVSTPKENAAKDLLYKYIEDKYGSEILKNMVSINHQTLNSFYNKEEEASNDPSFSIPGLDAPTHSESLGFRKV